MVQFLAVAVNLISSVQPSYRAHLASYSMVTRFLYLWAKLLGHEDDQSLSFNANIMHVCTLCPLLHTAFMPYAMAINSIQGQLLPITPVSMSVL